MKNIFQLSDDSGTPLAQIYLHQMQNYRYHWHYREYECFMVLCGRAIYSCGEKVWDMMPGDLLVTDPGCGHASAAAQPETCGLVLRFSVDAIPYTAQPGYCCSLGSCIITEDRPHPAGRFLQRCAAGMLLELMQSDPWTSGGARAWLQLLTTTLCREFAGASLACGQGQERSAKSMLDYIDRHYREKLTLETLAAFTGYNRTYLSTFFKLQTGTNFHEYLTRIRFQYAVRDLTYTDKSLTEVALDNGFPELKLFNARFRNTFGQSPAQYRTQLTPALLSAADQSRSFCDPREPALFQILHQWLN